jgi:hypothetical protein
LIGVVGCLSCGSVYWKFEPPRQFYGTYAGIPRARSPRITPRRVVVSDRNIVSGPFDLPHAVCSCGRIYFEPQSEALWACARQHVEERAALQIMKKIMRERPR